MALAAWNVVLAAILLGLVQAYPYGAPDDPTTCRQMVPQHNVDPQRGSAPFEILVSNSTYFRVRSLTVTIQATGAYRIKGFLIQARRADWQLNQIEPIGRFAALTGTKVVCTGPNGSGMTHTSVGSRDEKKTLKVTWIAPNQPQGHILFKVTIVSNKGTFWVAEDSAIVSDGVSPAIPPRKEPEGPVDGGTSIVPIDHRECGQTMGCYRNPPNCIEGQCQAFLAWKDRGKYVDFQMSGDTDGWIAVGFSEDTKMGKDSVVECVRNKNEGLVYVQSSWNEEGGKTNKPQGTSGLSNIEKAYKDGFVRCDFSREKQTIGSYVDLSQDFYLLMAWGKATGEGVKLIHAMEPYKYPFVSKHKINLVENLNISGTYRWLLVKIHGILMIVGWMMCASVAIMMARYYKLMWPNDRMCGTRVWFAVHRGCNLIAMFCTIVGFILIFIHVGGYSHMPDLPAKAHPPLGITVTILVILNPLLAACRCSNKSRNRPIFNWIHWFFGTCGVVLSTPTLFIGLSLPKAFVPWWATWVMVAFVLFHLICELLLEIHGCINSRKQKQRQQEYELRKRNDPRGDFERYEPKPVGHRFKSIILSLYLFVVIVLGLVMIIAIAIG